MASGPTELADMWPGDLRGSWDHLRAASAAGSWRGGTVYDDGFR